MTKSDIQHIPESYARYIALAEDLPLNEAFQKSEAQLRAINIQVLEAKRAYTYAQGKWTIPDIIQHLTDNERIFCNRALRFARNDTTPLPGYDQDHFSKYAAATKRTITDLLDEYREVHQGSARLFSTFDKEMLLRSGKCADTLIAVLAIGYLILGHKTHHFNIITERYGIQMP